MYMLPIVRRTMERREGTFNPLADIRERFVERCSSKGRALFRVL
jgi:hypothetical protein